PDDIRLGHDTEQVLRVFFDLIDNIAAAARRLHFYFERGLGFHETEVDGIADQLTVDTHNAAAHLELELVGDGARQYLCDPHHLGSTKLERQPCFEAALEKF